jgi:hypothetical protein
VDLQAFSEGGENNDTKLSVPNGGKCFTCSRKNTFVLVIDYRCFGVEMNFCSLTQYSSFCES